MHKHRLKKLAFQNGYWRDIIEHTNARFGSDIKDCNGNEIFEGDKVRYADKVYPVEFTRGAFRIGDLLLNSCAEDTDNKLEIVVGEDL